MKCDWSDSLECTSEELRRLTTGEGDFPQTYSKGMISGLGYIRFCGVIGCCLLAMALGCQRAEETAPIIDKATGLRMASDLTFVIASGENRPMGCATLLNASDKSFYVAAPIELVKQPGCRIVEWRGEFDGQKFERVEHSEFEVLASEPGLEIAIVRVLGTR